MSQLRIERDDPRYRTVVDKRFNARFTANPDYVCLVESPAQVETAVEDAVRDGRRVVATSGGHCLEGFVCEPDVRVILDVSPMKRIYYDDGMGAIAVEAGATVGETFRTLFDHWGSVIPLGEYPGIGMGGHVAGGAFGFLCRQLGLAADYLHAVEVVTVDAQGRARCVTATRDARDPNHDLWWAHTGAGGGNFGIVTRYWFRSTNSDGADPRTLLPRAPESITTFRLEWDWNRFDRAAFVRLLDNHGRWHARHSAPDSPYASLWTLLIAHRRQLGNIVFRGLSTAGDEAEHQIDECLTACGDGLPSSGARELSRLSWLEFALNPFPDLFGMPPDGVRTKVKDALLKRPFTEHQAGVAYDYLTSAAHEVMGGMLGLASYGCRVNSVSPSATASPHRGSIFDTACTTGWLQPGEDAVNLAWVRAFYRDLFADTGGVPVPGDAYDGALINHPDTDVADATWNTSGVPWSTMYYHGNYARLQRIKAQWDPRNVFRHALSIRVE
jgi:aclacinomycin oxidase